MSKALINIGGFKFSTSTASYSKLVSNYSYRWEAHKIYGGEELLEATGITNPTLTIEGELFPQLQNIYSLSYIKSLAKKQEPLLLTASSIPQNAEFLGLWGITNISIKDSEFLPDGTPLMKEFTISLKYHSEPKPAAIVQQAYNSIISSSNLA